MSCPHPLSPLRAACPPDLHREAGGQYRLSGPGGGPSQFLTLLARPAACPPDLPLPYMVTGAGRALLCTRVSALARGRAHTPLWNGLMSPKLGESRSRAVQGGGVRGGAAQCAVNMRVQCGKSVPKSSSTVSVDTALVPGPTVMLLARPSTPTCPARSQHAEGATVDPMSPCHHPFRRGECAPTPTQPNPTLSR